MLPAHTVPTCPAPSGAIFLSGKVVCPAVQSGFPSELHEEDSVRCVHCLGCRVCPECSLGLSCLFWNRCVVDLCTCAAGAVGAGQCLSTWCPHACTHVQEERKADSLRSRRQIPGFVSGLSRTGSVPGAPMPCEFSEAEPWRWEPGQPLPAWKTAVTAVLLAHCCYSDLALGLFFLEKEWNEPITLRQLLVLVTRDEIEIRILGNFICRCESDIFPGLRLLGRGSDCSELIDIIGGNLPVLGQFPGLSKLPFSRWVLGTELFRVPGRPRSPVSECDSAISHSPLQVAADLEGTLLVEFGCFLREERP